MNACEFCENTKDLIYIENEDIHVCKDCLNVELEKCPICDSYHYSTDLNYIENEDIYICDNCLEEKYICCDNCGEYHLKIDSTYIEDTEEYICVSCREESYYLCEDCNKWYYEDSTTYIESEMQVICDDCLEKNYAYCNNCEEWHNKNNMYYVECEDEYICENCYCEDYGTCEGCNEIFPIEDLHFSNDSPYCENCYEDCYNENSIDINSYSYKPSPNFHKLFRESENEVLTMGIEIETEIEQGTNLEELQEKVNNIENEGLFYFKEDGSLDNGVEIVSHPFTENYFKNYKNTMFENIFNLNYEGLEIKNTCGIHVHLSKNSFSNVHLYKFLKFFYNPGNFDFILKISQRDKNNLNRWSNLKSLCKKEIINRSKVKNQIERYTGVNLKNEKTVEIRIFKSSLEKEEVFKNIEFLLSLYEFTKHTSMEKITLGNYLEFIKNKTSYRNLNDFIRSF